MLAPVDILSYQVLICLNHLPFLENVSDVEDKQEQEKSKVRRRKRKATSPVEETKSSDESENSSTESVPIKSKVAKASKQKNKINVDDFFEEARYFVMKSNNHENVALSKAKVCLLLEAIFVCLIDHSQGKRSVCFDIMKQ